MKAQTKKEKPANIFVRIVSFLAGIGLLIFSVFMDLSVIGIPVGIATGLGGVGLIVWSIVGGEFRIIK